VFLNKSKYFITGSENTPRLAIVLLLSSKREHVKLNWVSTFLGKDQSVILSLHDLQLLILCRLSQ
jgi:hypothetical protein